MNNSLDVLELARDVDVDADTDLHIDLLAKGNSLYSPNPSRDGRLIQTTKSGQEIGVLKNGQFVRIDKSKQQD